MLSPSNMDRCGSEEKKSFIAAAFTVVLASFGGLTSFSDVTFEEMTGNVTTVVSEHYPQVFVLLAKSFLLYLATIMWGYVAVCVGLSKSSSQKRADEALFASQLSLNYLRTDQEGSTLLFRTMANFNLPDWCTQAYGKENFESYIREPLLQAAHETTVNQSVMFVSDFKAKDMIYKAIFNKVSEKYSAGYLDCDFGIPVIEKKYWLGLTCEQPEPDDTFDVKIRVMIISDGCLRRIPDRTEPPKFEFPGHKARWKCLQQMHKVFLNDEKIKNEKIGDRWYQELVLRQISIFRPLHYPGAHKDGVSFSRRQRETKQMDNDFDLVEERNSQGQFSDRIPSTSESATEELRGSSTQSTESILRGNSEESVHL